MLWIGLEANFLGYPSFPSPGGVLFVSRVLDKAAWLGPFPLLGMLTCEQEWVVSGVHLCVCLCESDLPVL